MGNRNLSQLFRQLGATSLIALLCAAPMTIARPATAGPFSTVAVVNDNAVTQFEVDQRMRFMSLLRAPNATRESVTDELILERLKMQAATSLGIVVSDSNLEAGLSEFAARGNMGTDEFIAALRSGGVEPETYRDFVKVGLAWREFVRMRILPTVDISDRDVDNALVKLLDTPQINSVLISELIIPAPPGQEAAAEGLAARIAAGTNSEAAFAAAARQYSASPSAQSGGRMEWMRVADLPQGLDSILLGLQPGQVSPVLQIPGAVVLFYLRDTRGSLRPGTQSMEVEYLTLTVQDTQTASAILADTTSCDTFYQAAGSAASAVQRHKQPSNTVSQQVGLRLAALDENEASVTDMGNAAEIVMLCSRKRSMIAELDDPLGEATGEAILPPRESAREQVFNIKINEAADAHLQELRANAIIRRN